MARDGRSSSWRSSHARDIRLEEASHVHQSTRKAKERLLSPRGTETIKYPDKPRAQNHLPRQGKPSVDDELVKHMSNLPAYLQRIEKADNFQEKVLNVGVLDWTRLEKWKLDQKADIKRGCNPATSVAVKKSSKAITGSCSPPAAVPSKTSSRRSGVKGPLDSDIDSFDEDGRKQRHKPANGGPKMFSDRDRKILPANSSSGRSSVLQVTVGEGDKKKELAQEIDLKQVKSSGPGKRPSKSCKLDLQKKDREGKNVSEAGVSSSSIHCSREEKARESYTEVSRCHQPRHRKEQSLFLFPRRFPQSSIPDMFKRNERSIPSAPCSTEPNRCSFSDSFSSGDLLHSGPILSDIPMSCPLPSQFEARSTTVPPAFEQTPDNTPFTSPSELQRFWSFNRNAKRHGSNGEAAVLDFAADPRKENRENPDPEARRSRHPSPNRRFSFSLGHMARSFSFKETTSLPQLGPTYISTKSGPVTNNDSPCCDIANQEKTNPSSTRGRSSPLRRFLDPLLKSKSMSSHQCTESIQPMKPENPTGPLLNEKPEKLTVQAVLQLTVKNGNPFFKFVVENSSNDLAATLSNSVPGRKNGSFRSSTFYSVDEIKKKGFGWIGQGNKAKGGAGGGGGGGFAYNCIGQMKLSNNIFSDWNTECILFGIDSRNTDKHPSSSISNGELAAIVFKLSSNENGDPNSVTVILPGGVHGLPEKGEPSPLIDRWVSGGSCDCGGWDVGCKLHVLCNKNNSLKDTKTSRPLSTSDHLELFSQTEAEPDRLVFSLAPFREGMYSIEFDSSISLLQAFSICIAFISCFQEAKGSPLASTMQEPTTFIRKQAPKVPIIFQHSRYAPCPPLSPVGRV